MRHHSCDGDRGQMAATASQMQAYAARTADFLSVIEKAVSRLTADRDVVLTLARDTEAVLRQLKDHPPTELIDEEGRVCRLLEQAAASALRQHEGLIHLRDSARADTELRPEDGVVEGFEQLIAGFASLHNVIEDLRDTVETLDSMKSPVLDGAFANVDDLFAALQTQH